MDRTQQQYDDIDGLKFTAYVAFAICDKEFDSPILNVYAPSILPYMAVNDPEIKAARVVSQPDITTTGGQEIQSEVAVKNYIEAVYFGLHTNRELPPDIRKGEQVLLLRIQNTDTYYWISMGRDDNLRRCERYKIRVSDENSFQKDLDDENTYWFEIDTLLNKHVWIQTSKSDSEHYIYTFKINSVQNTVTIHDDIGNSWILESDTPRIRARNSEGSFVDIVGNRILSQNASGSFVDIIDNRIYTQNSDGSMVDTNGDRIRSQNATGSTVDINSNRILMRNATGSFIDINDERIDIDADVVAISANDVRIRASRSMAVSAGSITCPWVC